MQEMISSSFIPIELSVARGFEREGCKPAPSHSHWTG